jgi:hypothetical protein
MDNLKKALNQYLDFVKILKTYGVVSTTCVTDMKSNCLRISAKLHDSDVQESGHTAHYVYEQLVRHSDLLNDNFKIRSHVSYNDFFNIVNITIIF